MAAASNNKYDVYEWIKKIYDSCQTTEQLATANNLRRKFEKLYNDSDLNWDLDWYRSYNNTRILNSPTNKSNESKTNI